MAIQDEALNRVILQKLASLDQVLAELRSLGKVSVQILHDDWRIRRAVERDLQVLVRNFIVHRYERVDVEILVDMVNRHLSDFERFRDEILSYVRG